MIQKIRCTECEKDNPLPFHLEWTVIWRWCGHCNNPKSLIKNYQFCSDECLKKFINKFANHEHKYSETLPRGCQICGLLEEEVKEQKQVKEKGEFACD